MGQELKLLEEMSVLHKQGTAWCLRVRGGVRKQDGALGIS